MKGTLRARNKIEQNINRYNRLIFTTYQNKKT